MTGVALQGEVPPSDPPPEELEPASAWPPLDELDEPDDELDEPDDELDEPDDELDEPDELDRPPELDEVEAPDELADPEELDVPDELERPPELDELFDPDEPAEPEELEEVVVPASGFSPVPASPSSTPPLSLEHAAIIKTADPSAESEIMRTTKSFLWSR